MPLEFSSACYRSKGKRAPVLSPHMLTPVLYPSHRRIVAIFPVLEVYSNSVVFFS